MTWIPTPPYFTQYLVEDPAAPGAEKMRYLSSDLRMVWNFEGLYAECKMTPSSEAHYMVDDPVNPVGEVNPDAGLCSMDLETHTLANKWVNVRNPITHRP